MTKRELHQNIMEDISFILKETLKEDISPIDDNGNTHLSTRISINLWRMIYRLMDNVKTVMDNTIKGKCQGNIGRLGEDDVKMIIDYINDSLKNIMNTYTYESLMTQVSQAVKTNIQDAIYS